MRGLDQLVGGARLGQVAREDRGLAVDLLGRLLGDVAVEVVDQHLRALADEQLRRRPADAARRAGDDRALAVKQSQVCRLLEECVGRAFLRFSWLTGQSAKLKVRESPARAR